MYLQVSDETSRAIAQRQKGRFLGIPLSDAQFKKSMSQLRVTNLVIVDDEAAAQPLWDGYVHFLHRNVVVAYHRVGLQINSPSFLQKLKSKLSRHKEDCGCDHK